MQKRILAAAAAFLVAITAAGSVYAATRPVPVDKGAPITTDGVPGGIKGDFKALEQSLNESSPIRYRILVVDSTEGEDPTAYLERVAAQWGEPKADSLLLVLFATDNWNLRFFMGSKLSTAGLTVDEMLTLVRTHYFPLSRKGDPAGGLTALVRAVNGRMAGRPAANPPVDPVPAPVKPDPVPPLKLVWDEPRQAMQSFLYRLETGDTKVIRSMVPEAGLVTMPYRRVGAPETELTGNPLVSVVERLFRQSAPRLEGYQINEKRIDLVVGGLNRVTLSGGMGKELPVTGLVKLSLREEAPGAWKLWLVAVDDQGLLQEELKSGAYQRPFAWFNLEVGALGGTGGSMEWRREPYASIFEPTWVYSLAQARELLGPGAVLPQSMDGKPISLYQDVDKNGNLVMKGAGLGEGQVLVRYRPAADHAVLIRTSQEFTVTREQRLINGRPALLLTYTAPKGRIRAEVWIDDGNWVYELSNTGDLNALVSLAASMR